MEDKTKEHLIEEIESLRRQVARLEQEKPEGKWAKQALRESEQRLGIILQNSPIPAFVIDKNHKVIYWNAALEKCSGVKAKEVIGTEQHWRAFYSEKRPCMVDLLVDDAAEQIPQ